MKGLESRCEHAVSHQLSPVNFLSWCEPAAMAMASREVTLSDCFQGSVGGGPWSSGRTPVRSVWWFWWRLLVAGLSPGLAWLHRSPGLFPWLPYLSTAFLLLGRENQLCLRPTDPCECGSLIHGFTTFHPAKGNCCRSTCVSARSPTPETWNIISGHMTDDGGIEEPVKDEQSLQTPENRREEEEDEDEDEDEDTDTDDGAVGDDADIDGTLILSVLLT